MLHFKPINKKHAQVHQHNSKDCRSQWFIKNTSKHVIQI